ncbi:LytR/AlgR family response regulator transcription factor [Eudoraea sp.]|uniref:LytR/AlgR family response regulator transcription factor n=1 Tax=Eudoraea sp. TaxID=1979955 RepID=UPI003C714E17
MNVVIVEDEIAAGENLVYLLDSIDSTLKVVAILDSVRTSVEFFSNSPGGIDLVFMDIHLADGLSFEIFDKVKIEAPVIFTTAYDQYALKAFKVNSIDYLLKPINEEELSASLEKFKGQFKGNGLVDDQVAGLLQLIKGQSKSYKSMYLVNHRDQLIPLKTENIAYIYIDNGMVKAITQEKQIFIFDKKLEDLEEELDPKIFYRVNRQFIVCKGSVTNIKYYFGGKLIVNVVPASDDRIVVSKAKAPDFKRWMDS